MEVAAVPLNQEELSLLAACPLFQKGEGGWLGSLEGLEGAGLTLFGLVGRFMVSGFFRGMGGFGMGGGWAYSGPPELEEAIMGELGIAQASPFSGIQSVMLAIPTLALVIGLIMVIGGLILAYVLWKQGKKGG